MNHLVSLHVCPVIHCLGMFVNGEVFDMLLGWMGSAIFLLKKLQNYGYLGVSFYMTRRGERTLFICLEYTILLKFREEYSFHKSYRLGFCEKLKFSKRTFVVQYVLVPLLDAEFFRLTVAQIWVQQ